MGHLVPSLSHHNFDAPLYPHFNMVFINSPNLYSNGLYPTGVGSLIFRASRPFHPVRLRDLLDGIGSADMDKRVAAFKASGKKKPRKGKKKKKRAKTVPKTN